MELAPDIGLFIWTLITFGLLVLLLSRFAFKPVARLLAQREKVIWDSLEAARQTKVEAQQVLAKTEKQLQESREESRHIIAEGQNIVAQMKKESEQQGRQEASRLILQARSEADREIQQKLDEFKETIANLSVRIARQVIKTELDEKKHEALADDFIERLKKNYEDRPR